MAIVLSVAFTVAGTVVGAPAAQMDAVAATAPDASPKNVPFTDNRHVTTCTSSPFVSRPSARVWYRIPSIAKDAHGVLYAFAEKRDRASGDDGNFDISMVTSGNNGCSWSAPRVIANDGSGRFSNPASVRTKAGDVMVMVTDSNHFLNWYSSADGFGQRHRVQAPIEHALTGIGHAAVLDDGTMVFAIAANGFKLQLLETSDDGRTWWWSKPLDGPNGRSLIEPTIARTSDDEFVVSMRDRNTAIAPGKNRYLETSEDFRDLDDDLVPMTTPKVVAVGASMLEGSGKYDHRLYFSAPAWVTTGHYTSRRELSIFVSTTDGRTWRTVPFPLEFDNRPGAYSDLALLDGYTMGAVYENGTSNYVEQIRFTSFKLSTLEKWTKATSTLTHGTLTSHGVTVTAHARGVANPWGSVTLTITNTSTGRVATVKRAIGFTARGKVEITMPRLGRGSYRVTASYTGTPRIASSTMAVGSIRL